MLEGRHNEVSFNPGMMLERIEAALVDIHSRLHDRFPESILAAYERLRLYKEAVSATKEYGEAVGLFEEWYAASREIILWAVTEGGAAKPN